MPEEKPRAPFDGVAPQHHEQEKIERLRRAMYSRSLSPNIKDKPRHELEQVSPVVGEDWVRKEPTLAGSHVAPRTMQFARKALRGLVWTSGAFFVGAVGFFGYYFFIGSGSSPVSPGNIDIAVSGPLHVQSGGPTELQIAVVNRNRVALELADLVIRYPSGTRSPTDLATNLKEQRIPLGTIEPGGRRQGTVSAVFAGAEGARESVSVELEYRLQNSNAIFVSESPYQIIFASSPVILSIEGNSEVTSGQPIEFKVTIAANADAPVKDVLLSAQFPFGFSLTSVDPVAAEKNLWALGDLNPGQKKVVTLRGVMDGESGDARVFRFSAGTRKTLQDKTLQTVLADYTHHLTISKPFLGIAIAVNKDNDDASAVVGPGELVNVSLTYTNHLSSPITDAVVVAQLGGTPVNGATVRSNDGFYRSNDRVMYWDKTTAPALSTIPAGGTGTLTFSFQAPDNEALVGIRDPKLSINVQAAGKRIGDTSVPESLQATAMQTIRIASDLQLIAQGLYYSNPFGSSGPMPPKANTETTYAIVLSLTNTTNEITNAVVKASLQPYVRWTGIYSPSGEDISFSQTDGTIIWKVGTVGARVGVDGAPPKQAAIAIGFTPSDSQIGQQPPLIRSVTLSGRDAATGQAISRTAADVTTNIIGDQGFLPSNATVVK